MNPWVGFFTILIELNTLLNSKMSKAVLPYLIENLKQEFLQEKARPVDFFNWNMHCRMVT